MNILWIHFHKWSKWETRGFYGQIVSILFKYESDTHWITIQERTCLECGIKEKREP